MQAPRGKKERKKERKEKRATIKTWEERSIQRRSYPRWVWGGEHAPRGKKRKSEKERATVNTCEEQRKRGRLSRPGRSARPSGARPPHCCSTNYCGVPRNGELSEKEKECDSKYVGAAKKEISTVKTWARDKERETVRTWEERSAQRRSSSSLLLYKLLWGATKWRTE